MLTIAYLGPEHTNAHLAAQQRFGRTAKYLHAPTVDDVFSAVERRRADVGVVPVENSLEGAVTHTLDRFIDFVDTPVAIQGEIEQPIHHYVILGRGMQPQTVRLVFSHPQALAQCRRWLSQHMPHAALRETNSTADAVSYVLENTRVRAAIGRKELAEAHGLRALPISSDRENKTRFLVIGLGRPRKARRNKTSVLFGVKDRPGALYDALVPFKRNRINLTKIESRPSKKKAWEYLFFIDLEGHASDPRVRKACEGLERSASFVRVLGSYPTGK
ncbi:MAG: prephenate dehydratase [Candidatus Omnitrophica bacterium]|nr:prephenate dehydratase [Candidatus Omnitrophota bacterium]